VINFDNGIGINLKLTSRVNTLVYIGLHCVSAKVWGNIRAQKFISLSWEEADSASDRTRCERLEKRCFPGQPPGF
jgi:hypothetical protein